MSIIDKLEVVDIIAEQFAIVERSVVDIVGIKLEVRPGRMVQKLLNKSMWVPNLMNLLQQ